MQMGQRVDKEATLARHAQSGFGTASDGFFLLSKNGIALRRRED
jgi:hypothetical protein